MPASLLLLLSLSPGHHQLCVDFSESLRERRERENFKSCAVCVRVISANRLAAAAAAPVFLAERGRETGTHTEIERERERENVSICTNLPKKSSLLLQRRAREEEEEGRFCSSQSVVSCGAE